MKVLTVGLLIATMLCCTAQANMLRADSGIAAKAIKNCHTDLRYLNQVVGWQVKWPRQWQSTITAGPAAAGKAIATWSEAPAAIAQTIQSLRSGIAAGQTAPQVVVQRVQQQVRDFLFALTTSNSKYSFKDVEHNHAAQWNAFISKDVVPAVLNFSTFLSDEYLPATKKTVGLAAINGGEQCFYESVKWWTTLDLSLDDIEAIGRRFLDDSQAQLLATGTRGDTVASLLADLRVHRETNNTEKKGLMTLSATALTRAHDKTLLAFSQRANKGIVVSEMPKYLQDSAPAGYYARAQGNTPARFIINLSRPNERRLMAEVLAFHEGIPGHHLWSAYPRKTPSTGYNSGLLEGWALYAEYLADEMALYSSTYDRQGMITKHLWAASRLIVEPGLHCRGWSREDAIQFMLKNTVMSRTEIEIEVDRYIAMPGQSLSYILGADLIISERERAKKLIGRTFNLAQFHDVILVPGVRSLPQVREDIRAWVQSALALQL